MYHVNVCKKTDTLGGKRMQDNKDVRNALFLRGLYRVARPVLWYGFFVIVILKYVVFGKYEIRITHIPVYLGLAIIILLPFFKGWIRSAAQAGGFKGRVEAMSTRRELVDSHRSVTGRRGLGDAYHILILTVSVRDKNGKLHKIDIREPSFLDVNYIKNGDRVIHRFGSDYLEKASKSGDTDVLCVCCGTLCRMQNDICYNCRRTLLKRSVYDTE